MADQASREIVRASRRQVSQEIRLARNRGEVLERRRNPDGTYYAAPPTNPSARQDRTRAASVNQDIYDPRGSEYRNARRGSGTLNNPAPAFQGDPRVDDRLRNNGQYSAASVDPDLLDPRGADQLGPRQTATAAAQVAASDGSGTITQAGTSGLQSMQGRQTAAFTSLSPRPYFIIQPLDNRYDFLTGRKVFDSTNVISDQTTSGRSTIQGTNSGASQVSGTGATAGGDQGDGLRGNT